MTSRDALRAEIARVRTQGYATVDQEFELGLRTLSVPLKNYRGEVLAAMNISAQASRVSLSHLVDGCLPALLQAQARLRSTL
jgi:IclR family pca regulon transcriptional regulator